MTSESPVPPARTWLVTGAAGFIGSNLARYLLERGQQVTGLDNFFSGKQRNIDGLTGSFGEAFRFIEGDILDPAALARAAAGAQVVVHLAAQVSVQRSIDDPVETHDINASGFLHTALAAAAAGSRHLVYASSCAVYGDSDALPLGETSATRVLSPYAATKLANECYAAGLGVGAPNLASVGLRFFNIFGPDQDAAGGYAAVIPKWLGMLLAGEQPIVFGDGSATRDFCFVENVCDAVWLAARGEQPRSGVFNVATGARTSLSALYEVIRDELQAAGHPVAHPAPLQEPWRAGDILHSVGDPGRALAELGFSPRIGLREGIRRLIAHELTGAGVDGARTDRSFQSA